MKVRNGGFTIPAAIRRRYGIEPGSKVTFVGLGDDIYLLPPIPEEVLRRWQSLEREEAVRMARWIVETYRWEGVSAPAVSGEEAGGSAEGYAYVALATVSRRGRVVIPASLRERGNGRMGETASIVVAEERAYITLDLKDPIDAAYGMLAGGPDYLRLLVEEHARELEDERP